MSVLCLSGLIWSSESYVDANCLSFYKAAALSIFHIYFIPLVANISMLLFLLHQMSIKTFIYNCLYWLESYCISIFLEIRHYYFNPRLFGYFAFNWIQKITVVSSLVLQASRVSFTFIKTRIQIEAAVGWFILLERHPPQNTWSTWPRFCQKILLYRFLASDELLCDSASRPVANN